jgi:DNA-binding transcriptional regulator GbsR (MarR family)
MHTSELKEKFVQLWGTVGMEWGINKTMAQLHGLLLASDHALTTDQIMSALTISRGNANMNLRDLMSWGLIYRESRPGERKEYFYAEKDIWEVAQKIARERTKRELHPMMKTLEQLLNEIEKETPFGPEEIAFKKVLVDIHSLGKKCDQLLETVLKFEQNRFFKPILTLIRNKNNG